MDVQYRVGKIEGHATPQVILALNSEGTVTISDQAGQVYEMKTIATRE